MLKLYYAKDKAPLVIGFINWNYETRGMMNENPYTANLQYLEGTDLDFLPEFGSGFAEFINIADQSATGTYKMYLDAALTQETLFIFHYAPNSGYKSFYVKVENVLGGGNENVIYEGIIWPDWESETSKCHLSSLYSSPKDLGSNKAEYEYFINKMIETEREIIDNPEWNAKNLAYSPITAPFVANHSKFNAGIISSIEYSAGPVGFWTQFISSASVYFWLTNRRLINVDAMKLANGSTTYPAVMYDPYLLSVKGYERKQGNISGEFKFHYNNTAYLKDYNISDIAEKFDDIEITEQAQAIPRFIQTPSAAYRTDEADSIFGFHGSNNWIGWNDELSRLYPWGIGGYWRWFVVLQMIDVDSLNNMANNYANDRYGLEVKEGTLPLVTLMAIGRGNAGRPSRVETDTHEAIFPTAASTYIRPLGSEIVERWYANNTSPVDVPKPYVPSANDEIPDAGESDFGGRSDEDSIGGDGTWTASDDNTTTDFTNPDLSEDENSPLPPGVYAGKGGNTYFVSMNTTQYLQLCDALWVDNDMAFLRAMKEVTGQATINQGVIFARAQFASVPTTGTAELKAIAGFALPTVIGCSTFNQYVRDDFGSITIEKVFGNFLDYQAQIMLHLPFASPIALPAPVVMGKTIHLGLTRDLIEGTGVYSVDDGEGHLLAEIPCMLSIEIPLSTSDYLQSGYEVMTGIFNQFIGAGSQSYAQGKSEVQGAMSGLPGVNPNDSYGRMLTGDAARGNFMINGISTAINGATQLVSYDESRAVAITSGFGGPGSVGAMGNHWAYVTISRPYVRIDNDYYHYNGAPSDIITQLSNCRGYVEVGKFIPNGTVTDEELVEIQQLLIDGVYM